MDIKCKDRKYQKEEGRGDGSLSRREYAGESLQANKGEVSVITLYIHFYDLLVHMLVPKILFYIILIIS